MILTNARIVTLDATNRVLDCGAVEIGAHGIIGRVGKSVRPRRGQRVVDAGGRLLMPALINAHTHLYSTLARGMSANGTAPRNFVEILKKVWWKLDRALTEQDIYYSALVGLIDSAKNGAGTLIDHHSSPNHCPFSLDIVDRAFREVGLRGALCYETSDRNGPKKTTEAIEENVRFLERAEQDGLVKASFGLHASFTLSDKTLARCREAGEAMKSGFHVHVSEDAADEAHAHAEAGKSVVRRLADAGVLGEKTVAAHCVNVNDEDMGLLAEHGVNVVHNPQSNCNNAVGTANVAGMLRNGVMVGMGSDGFAPNMWKEFATCAHVAKLRSHDPRAGFAESYAAALVNNREIAQKIWGWNLGRIETGADADLTMYDYYPPTPLNSENLLGHLVFGVAHAPVHSLMVQGKFVVQDHLCVSLDEIAIARRAAKQAEKLWSRL